jgi:dipeptidyl aminopeptidase/acylaminoacyl peptidase
MDRRPPPAPVASGDGSEDRQDDDGGGRDGEGDLRQVAVEPLREGGSLAYVRRAGARRRIWVREPAQGLERPVSPPGQDCASPAFSPDRRLLAFICVEEGVGRLYLLDRDTGKTAPLYEERLSASGPSWWEAPEEPVRVGRE